MPQASKQLLNVRAVPPMYIIIALLAGYQSSILSSSEWHNDMNPAFLSTIMAPNFNHLGYETSMDVPGAKGQLRTMLPNISTATVILKTCDAYLGFQRSTLHIPLMEAMGMESVKWVIKNGKCGQWLKGFNLLAHRISWTTWLRYSRTRAALCRQAPSEHPVLHDINVPPPPPAPYPQPSRGSPHGDKIAIGYLNPAFWGSPIKGDKIRSGYISPTFSGAQKCADWLLNPCRLGVPNRKGQNQQWLHHPYLLGGPKMGRLAT